MIIKLNMIQKVERINYRTARVKIIFAQDFRCSLWPKNKTLHLVKIKVLTLLPRTLD